MDENIPNQEIVETAVTPFVETPETVVFTKDELTLLMQQVNNLAVPIHLREQQDALLKKLSRLLEVAV